MVAARVSVWQLHSSGLGRTGSPAVPCASRCAGRRSGSPAACRSPCWPFLAFASRSRTGFDAVERPWCEGYGVLRCSVKVSRLPGPRSDADGRAGSPSAGRQQTGSRMAGRQRTGSHVAGHQRTGSRVTAGDRVTGGRPLWIRVTPGRPAKDRVTHGHLGQGHPRPASARTANHAGGRCQGPPPSPGTPRPPPPGATYGPLAAQTTSRDPRDLTLQISETLARRCSGGGAGDDWR